MTMREESSMPRCGPFRFGASDNFFTPPPRETYAGLATITKVLWRANFILSYVLVDEVTGTPSSLLRLYTDENGTARNGDLVKTLPERSSLSAVLIRQYNRTRPHGPTRCRPRESLAVNVTDAGSEHALIRFLHDGDLSVFPCRNTGSRIGIVWRFSRITGKGRRRPPRAPATRARSRPLPRWVPTRCAWKGGSTRRPLHTFCAAAWSGNRKPMSIPPFLPRRTTRFRCKSSPWRPTASTLLKSSRPDPRQATSTVTGRTGVAAPLAVPTFAIENTENAAVKSGDRRRSGRVGVRRTNCRRRRLRRAAHAA